MLCIRRNKDKSNGESAKALKDAQNSLRRVNARTEEVRAVAQALKRTRERNHFAEQLQDLLGIDNPGRGYGDARQ